MFGRGQMVGGVAMLGGSVAGGVIAQVTSLGVPFLLRVGVLCAMFVVAFAVMRDLGFTPARSRHPLGDMKRIFSASLDHGLRNPPVRWVMLAAPFGAGVGIYTFYALQPFLLDLYGNEEAYGIAGLAAAIIAGAQILGGYLAPRIRGLFVRRTSALILATAASVALLAGLGLTTSFVLALVLLVLWGLVFAASMPIRQAYLNGMIPSEQRATVLSFDSLMGNTGGVVIQPILGKSADVWSYGTSYVIGAGFQALALPFLLLSRRENVPADTVIAPRRRPRRSQMPSRALVTGGGRGIGAGIARELAAAGWHVTVTGRSSRPGARRWRSEIGGVAVVGDVSKREDVERMIAAAEPIDLLVANAGVALWEDSWETDPDEWWRILEVNVLGAYLTCRLTLPGMIERGGGRIVITGSGSSYLPGSTSSAYNASKAAVGRFGESLAGQVKEHNVQVFVISPGLVKTEMTGRFGDDMPWTPPELAPRLVLELASGRFDALSRPVPPRRARPARRARTADSSHSRRGSQRDPAAPGELSSGRAADREASRPATRRRLSSRSRCG